MSGIYRKLLYGTLECTYQALFNKVKSEKDGKDDKI
jgi:hypothetical protein